MTEVENALFFLYNSSHHLEKAIENMESEDDLDGVLDVLEKHCEYVEALKEAVVYTQK